MPADRLGEQGGGERRIWRRGHPPRHGGRCLRPGARSSPTLTGLTLRPSIRRCDIIAGAGTVGLEILEQLPDVDVIVVPIGGGGLLAGIAAAVKQVKPRRAHHRRGAGGRGLRCAGVSMPGIRCDSTSIDTIADGLAAPFAGELTFPIIRDLVDDVVLVTDAEIAERDVAAAHPREAARGTGAVRRRPQRCWRARCRRSPARARSPSSVAATSTSIGSRGCYEVAARAALASSPARSAAPSNPLALTADSGHFVLHGKPYPDHLRRDALCPDPASRLAQPASHGPRDGTQHDFDLCILEPA